MSRDLYPYLRERAQMGTQGLSLGLGLSIAAHVLVVAAILWVPRSLPSPEKPKVTWVTLPAGGVPGVAGGEGPVEEGKEGERQRRVEEVAPKLSEPTGHTPTPNAFGTRETRPIQGTSTNPDSMGKAPVASKGKTPAANPTPGAAGTGGGGGIGAATGVPGLKAANGVGGGTGLVVGLEGDLSNLWYLRDIQTRITDNWKHPGTGFGMVQIYFRIMKDGTITGSRVYTQSQSPEFDQYALMAVTRAGHFAPLPPEFEGPWLGVTFRFTYLGK